MSQADRNQARMLTEHFAHMQLLCRESVGLQGPFQQRSSNCCEQYRNAAGELANRNASWP